MDMFGNSIGDNELAKKIAIKSERKKIERRIEDFTASLEDFIATEVRYISNGLAYGMGHSEYQLSDSEKTELIEALKTACLSVPKNAEKSMADLFGEVKKEDEEEKKEEEKKEPEQQQFPQNHSHREKTTDEIQRDFENNVALNPTGIARTLDPVVSILNPANKYFEY